MTAARQRISVVMATCNGAPFLARQLESVLGQTRPADEIVIVDDASQDDTVAVVGRYARSGPVRLEVNPARLGPNGNFEKGLRLSSGDLIFFCDQDDVWLPEKIEAMSRQADGADLLYSDAELIDDRDRVIRESELRDYLRSRPVAGDNAWFFTQGNCVSGHNLVISRALAERALPFPDGVMYDQWLALVAAATGGIAYLDRRLCRHRIHDRNFCNNQLLVKETQGSPRRPKGTLRERFLERQGRIRRLVDLLGERGLLPVSLEPVRDHFARLDRTFFDVPLFRHMVRNLDRYFPNRKGLDRLDQAIKFCRGARGYWLPSVKV